MNDSNREVADMPVQRTAPAVVLENPSAMARSRWSIPARIAALAVVLLATMLHRRLDQFTHPYLWVEDATLNLTQFAAHGWRFLFEPIVGYFILPIRIILASAASLSFRWLPEIAFALALAFTFAVMAAVAFSPTRLRHRFLCAAALMCVPIASEVFGVSLYAGWWGSLLAFLPLLWREEERGVVLRGVFLFVGGLSTPIVVGLVPLYALRAWLFRKPQEYSLLALCLGLALLQGYSIIANSAAMHGGNSMLGVGLAAAVTVEKFFGHYLFWSKSMPQSLLYPALGALLIALIAWAAYVRRSTLSWPFFMLVCLLLLTIAMSLVRAPVETMHSVMAGPRYFFMPYVVLSWCLLYLVDRRHLATSITCVLVMLVSLRTLVAYGPRTHQPIDWRSELSTCVTEQRHRFPVHYEGDAPHGIMWSVSLTGEDCRRLIERSLFDNELPVDRNGPSTPPT